jgi:hypothetical protein
VRANKQYFILIITELARGGCLYVKTPVARSNFERGWGLLNSKKESLSQIIINFLNTYIMEATTVTQTSNSYDTAINVVGAIFGTTHFVLQSLADLTAHAEGRIVEKISKGEIKASERVQYRKDTTLIKQEDIKNKIAEFKAKQTAKQ